jgi:hypothetical protein
MNELGQERLVQELLRSLESNALHDPAARSNARRRMLAVFDGVSTPAAQPTAVDVRAGDDDKAGPATLFEITDHSVAKARPSKMTGALAVAASLAVLVIAAALMNGGERRIMAGDDANVPAAGVSGFEASEVVPGLVLDIDDPDLSVKRVEPGLMILELRGRWSPTGDTTDLTIVSVDEWAPALLAETVPRVERPDSLRTWLGLSGLDISTSVPFDGADRRFEAESWIVTLTPGIGDCVEAQPCAEVASTAGGGSISLIAGATNELTSISLPGGPTLLAHVVYDGSTRLSEPAGAEILRSVRVEDR